MDAPQAPASMTSTSSSSTSINILRNPIRSSPPRTIHSTPPTSRPSPFGSPFNGHGGILPSQLPIPEPSSTPATPSAPRRLPTTSPPSARLRRLAPTQLKLPPTPPFPFGTARANTFKTWAATSSGRVGGAEARRKGSAASLGAESVGSSFHGGGTMEDDPFDLEFQFASPPPSSISPPRQNMAGLVDGPDAQWYGTGGTPWEEEEGDVNLQQGQSHPFALRVPTRPPNHRQDSSTTCRTNSTQPSFSTSPVLVSSKVFPSGHVVADRTSFPRDSLRPTDLRLPPPLTGWNRSFGRHGQATAPDVPDEILDDFGIPSSSRNSGDWSDDDGVNGGGRGPTRRTGDELLSPGAFLAAHVPRPVLVQFRDVFGANDTALGSGIATPMPRLPGTPHTRRQPPTAGASPSDGNTPTPLASIGIAPDQMPTPQPDQSNGRSPGGFSVAESFATFGVHTSATFRNDPNTTQAGAEGSANNRQREISAGSEAGSFTFSAYLEDDDPLRQSLNRLREADELAIAKVRANRPMLRSAVPLSTAPASASIPSGWAQPPTHVRYGTIGIPSPGSSGDETELVTPEQRDIALHSEAAGSSGRDIGTPTPRQKESAAGPGPVGLGIGLGLTLNPTSYRQPSHLGHDPRLDNLPLGITSTVTVEPKVRGPKRFKSLISLRMRLPSSRGGSKKTEEVPAVPEKSSSEASRLPTSGAGNVSLTGQPDSIANRPHTGTGGGSYVHLPSSSISNSLNSPLSTGTSTAFSVNSFDTASTGTQSKTDEVPWTGNLKEDLTMEGVTMRKDLTVNLWVDQEGAREVITTLHPIRWHTAGRSRQRAMGRIDGILGNKKRFDDLEEIMDDHLDEGNVFWDEGCLEFGMQPRKRAKWAFTYGAFEAFPCLRRVTLDGQQNFDFTSRVASLKHRTPGIYAVSGIEKGGAKWRFRYMVDKPIGPDPRARIIVPMSFYATPLFLLGFHAQKLSLTSTVGKALRPSLSSTKIPKSDFYRIYKGEPVQCPPDIGRASHPRSQVPPHPRPQPQSQPPIPIRSDGLTGSLRGRPDIQQIPYQPSHISTQAPSLISGTDLGVSNQHRPAKALQIYSEVETTPRASAAQTTRPIRPSTAQVTQTPLSSLTSGRIENDKTPTGPDTAAVAAGRRRPGTSAAAFPPLAVLDVNRVAPFLQHEPRTPVTAPKSATKTTFGRMRALTTITRPTTPLSAPLPLPKTSTTSASVQPTATVEPPMPHSAASSTSSFTSGLMRAKKSLTSLRPSSRGAPNSAGLSSKAAQSPLPIPSPLPTSSSLTVVETAAGRMRTKSSNHLIGRPSTSSGAAASSTRNDGSSSASFLSSFAAPFSRSRPPTAVSTSGTTATSRFEPLSLSKNKHQQPSSGLISSSALPSRSALNQRTPPQLSRRPGTAPNHAHAHHARSQTQTQTNGNPHGLSFGFGSYTATPRSGITYSALAMQQLEAKQGKKSPRTLRREFYGDGDGMGLGMQGVGVSSASAAFARISGSDVGVGVGGSTVSGKGLPRRPRTADPRGKI